ncbi:MAG: hypothetical protein KA354_17180 [Phycisphaerae bacterium]|nr:hypothetical protein [Phycisphaerae bacterium]
MSGPKAADVRLKLNRALETIRRQMGDIASYSAVLEQLGSSPRDAARCTARAVVELTTRALPPEAEQVCPWELPELAGLRRRISELMNEGAKCDQRADVLRAEAEALNQEADGLLARATTTCERVERTLGQQVHYLYEEDKQASEARTDAEQALARRGEATRKMQQVADQLKQARNVYDAVARLDPLLQAARRRVESLVAESQAAERIKEAVHRQARAIQQEWTSLASRLRGLDHARFAPGVYDGIRSDISRFEAAMEKGKHQRALEHAGLFMDRLRQLVEQVGAKQAEWDAGRQAGENDLKAAQEEIGQMDREQLERWAGKPEQVAAAYGQLSDASRRIEAGEFSEARQAISAALTSLRELHSVAGENQARQEQRQAIADAIMQALYDLGYDTPRYQYTEVDAQGRDDELSDLSVFAKHPGDVGDMAMHIHLDGHVALEVRDIPEGKEALCHEQLVGLQGRLAKEVDFEITDWGRAASVALGGKPEDGGVRFQKAEGQREQRKERM